MRDKITEEYGSDPSPDESSSCMKYYFLILILVVGVAIPNRSDAETFVTDKNSPLKRVQRGKEASPSVSFQGNVRLSGRVLVVRDIAGNQSRMLRVVFYPDKRSALLLPRIATSQPVKELLISNSEEATSMLLDGATAQMLLSQELLSVTIEATVTIHDYRSVIECDRRWYLARIISASRKQKIVIGALENVRVGCG